MNSLPLDGTYLPISFSELCVNHFCFPTFDGESTEEFKKRLSNIFNSKINYSCLPYPSVLRNKYIRKNEIFSGVDLLFYGEIIGSGVPIDFTDIEKGKTKELKFNKKAPEWRKVKEGLNIFGICNNPECKAYQKEVAFIPHLNNQTFNLNENITKILCPICMTIIKLKTCGFWKCEYQFKGKKIEKGKLIDFNSAPKETKDNEFEYYDPTENGNVIWTILIIFVIPKQKIKYKSS